MNHSMWPEHSAMRRWECVNEDLSAQHGRNMRDSIRFIAPPQPKEQLLYERQTARDEFQFNYPLPAAKPRRKPSIWSRIKAWLL